MFPVKSLINLVSSCENAIITAQYGSLSSRLCFPVKSLINLLSSCENAIITAQYGSLSSRLCFPVKSLIYLLSSCENAIITAQYGSYVMSRLAGVGVRCIMAFLFITVRYTTAAPGTIWNRTIINTCLYYCHHQDQGQKEETSDVHSLNHLFCRNRTREV